MAAVEPSMLNFIMPSNVTDITDTIDQRRWKAALMNWLDDMRFHLAVTLVWNRRVGLDRARADLRNFVARVDEALVGSHFHKLHKDKRVEAVFAFEGMAHDHTHVHSLWKAPSSRWFDLGKLFPQQRDGLWSDVVPSGTYDVEACNWFGGNTEVVGYVLKQQHRWSDPDLMVWASDFHRAR